MPNKEWQKVFKAAVNKAKEIRKKNPNLSYPQAMKQAWKDASIQKLKNDYKKKSGESSKKKGGSTRARGRPRGSKSKRRSTAKKPAKRSVKKRSTRSKK